MKRLIKKFCLFLIPFVVLLLLFFLFEPYDYFYLRHDAAYLKKPLSSMRQLIMTKPDKVALGDSRLANISMDYVKEITGEDWLMLGYGGANVGENIDLFWFATEHTQLTEVVFGLDFYTACGTQNAGRIEKLRPQSTNIYSFVSYFNYWLEALSNAKTEAVNLAGQLLNKPHWITYPEDPSRFLDRDDPTKWYDQEVPMEPGEVYRKNIEDYAVTITEMIDKNRLQDETLNQLQEVIDYCNEHGIKLTFVFPFMHESIQKVYDRLGVSAENEALKQFLIERATVYDLSLPGEFNSNDDNFYDGFHLTSPQKPFLAQLIFNGLEDPCIVRHVKG